MPPKRKLPAAAASTQKRSKLVQTTLIPPTPAAVAAVPTTPAPATEEEYDAAIVNRSFYPSVLRNSRCALYLSGDLSTPVDALVRALSARPPLPPVGPGDAVVHWFRTDLRVGDNTALHLASQTGAEVLGLYIFSPEDLDAHVVSPARIEFMIRSLGVLREVLRGRRIPLWVEVVENRKDVPQRVVQLAREWGAKRIYANMEYEVDEARRDVRMLEEGMKRGVGVEVVHDTCVVPPGRCVTKATGKMFAVYSPWYKAYLQALSQDPALLTLRPPPAANPESTLTTRAALFTSALPSLPPGKTLTAEETLTLHELYPAGSQAAAAQLASFLTQKGRQYAADRNTPSISGTSGLSPHFSAGTLSARTAVFHARAANSGKLSGGQSGLDMWISEVAWRDFYRHVLAAFPHVCMHKPFKPSFASILWLAPSSPLHSTRFSAWKAGRTGFPLVDAAMRQLAKEKFMPNRLRMVVASFLCKDLHIDWRLGEQYFAEQLVDGDFASNNGGWGFASSAGVDPQPYFRVFNPTAQGLTWDADGAYVRTWVEELRDYRGDVWKITEQERRCYGYPREIVEHAVQRRVAIEMYKRGIERGKGVV